MPMPQFRRGGDAAAQMTAEHNTTPRQPAPSDQPKGDNLYPGDCTECGVKVPAMQGKRSRVDGRWVVTHLPGGCDAPVEEEPSEPAVVQAEVNLVNGRPLYDGIYTWETLTAHRTFRLRTQASDDDFMPGVQIIQHLTGPDNTYDYTSVGHVKNGRLYIWKKHQDKQTLVTDAKQFIANPEQAEVAVACFRCHRTLTVPASIHNGMGPECAGKGI